MFWGYFQEWIVTHWARRQDVPDEKGGESGKKKEVVNMARKEKNGVNLAKRGYVSLANKRMSIGQKEDVAGK